MGLLRVTLVGFCIAASATAVQAARQATDPVTFDGNPAAPGASYAPGTAGSGIAPAAKLPVPWRGVTKKAERKTNYVLPTAFTAAALLATKTVSYNVASPCIAVVERDIVFLSSVVIPAGTQFIGTVAVEKSHDRILIDFHNIVFPTGDEVVFSGMALSLDGSAGIAGEVKTYKDASVANTVLRSVVAGTQSALAISAAASPIAAGLAQGLGGEATRELDTQRQQVTVSITVPEDTGIRVYFNQRLEY